VSRLLPAIALFMAPAAAAQWNDSALRPFAIDHRHAGSPAVDLSFLLDRPAGRNGFIRVQGGHFVKGDGGRIRFWGVHLTDWSPGSVLLPPKEDAPMWAESLARFGVNCVRLHFLDLASPRGIIDATKNDSRSFDPQQLDRLDFMVSELKSRGIYVDLNLNVGRSYKAGDGVKDFAEIRWGKGLVLYDPRLIELQKEYARQLLTHLNPYTRSEYRQEPAVAIVEIDNENGIGVGFRAPTAYYDDELTKDYNDWLGQNRSAAQLAKLRESAGVAAGAAVPRLNGREVPAASGERFRAEAAFYMSVEDRYYREMNRYLKADVGVKVPVIGTADHNHYSSGYPMLTSLLQLDALDGHVYWEHPALPGPLNTPMVNDPLHSTVVQLSRTAFAGKPYTVTETNHPFPNEWAGEGLPIIAAYGSFQDWDAILTYTFEAKRAADWQPYVGDPFDISLDPVRMTGFAAGALIFLRGDVARARDFEERSYSTEQVIDSLRLPASEAPYFTPGFSLAIPLEHGVRIRSLDGPATVDPAAPDPPDPIVSDTGQLSWSGWKAKHGIVTIDTDRTQALVGFVKTKKQLTNLAAEIDNEFASVTLTSLDSKALPEAARMLLSAGSRVANTGMKWNAEHTKLVNQGKAPSLIEPVTGKITLRNLQGAKSVNVTALDGSGCPLGEKIRAVRGPDGWTFAIGDPVTTWYLVSVER
jgi:hypothetical protein